jgi:hypothetical protein
MNKCQRFDYLKISEVVEGRNDNKVLFLVNVSFKGKFSRIKAGGQVERNQTKE